MVSGLFIVLGMDIIYTHVYDIYIIYIYIYTEKSNDVFGDCSLRV